MENNNDQLETEFEELVDKFTKLYEDHEEEINNELKLASNHLDNAVNLCEKYAIPIRSNISFISNNYTPKSFMKSEYKSLDSDIISDITGTYSELDWFGWEHSAVC